jgi:hypothetical protein
VKLNADPVVALAGAETTKWVAAAAQAAEGASIVAQAMMTMPSANQAFLKIIKCPCRIWRPAINQNKRAG